MAKKDDTLAAIKAANGTEVPSSLTQKQLDELLALAQGGDEKKAEFDEKLAEYAPADEDTTGKIRVTVNGSKGTGSYIHPDTRQVVRRDGDPVWLPEDAWTDQMIRDKYLTEVRK